MRLSDKINSLIKEQGFNLSEFHRKLEDQFKTDTVTYQTLYRAVKEKNKIRSSTLSQIAWGLSLTPAELKKGTEREEKYIRYDYNEKAYFERSPDELPFLVGNLVLKSKAKTPTEQIPADKGPSVKVLYGVQGQATCVIDSKNGLKKHVIKYGDSFNFDSTQPHHFENNGKRKAICIVVQYPPYP